MTDEEREKLLEELLRQLQPKLPPLPPPSNNSNNNNNSKNNPPPNTPSSPSSGGGAKDDSGGSYEIDGGKMPDIWFPNSKVTLRKNGQRIQKRWYNSKGDRKYDRDYTNHGNPKTHPNVPHDHTWNGNDRSGEMPVNPWMN